MPPNAGARPDDPDAVFGLIQSGLDNIDQGITIFDGALELVFANARITELLEMPAEMMRPGAAFEDVIRFNAMRGEYGPGDLEEQIRERVAAARRFEAHTLERVRPNGRVIRVSGWPLTDGGFATIYTDVTEQKRREETLESLVLARTEDLRRNEERLRLITNEAPAGIGYLNSEHVFEFVNARFANAYGLTPQEVIGRRAEQVLSSETMRVAGPHFERAQRGEQVDFDVTIRFPDQKERDVRTFLRPDGDLGAGIHGFYVLSVNVTKQKRAEAALMTAQKMEAVGQLSSGVAHDFNNLLTVILGNLTPVAEALGAAEPDQAALVEDMLAPAIRAARRGADLTQRLLAIARRQPVEARPVDAAEMVSGLAQLIRASLPERIDLTLALDGPAWTEVDPSQLETALLNLAMNARDAIPRERSGAIDIALKRVRLDERAGDEFGLETGPYVEIVVTDDGVGVPPEARHRIFEPFFSTKASIGGSGLGLALVYSFAQAAGGHIAHSGVQSGGARFQLLLPASAPGLDAGAEADRLESDDAVAGRLMLLVEDDAEVRTVITRALTRLGARVLEAEDAEEALRLIGAVEEIDFVLSDIAMPGPSSGAELAARLARERPGLPVALMTAHGGEDVLQRFDPVLRKPIERADLLAAVRRADARARERSPA